MRARKVEKMGRFERHAFPDPQVSPIFYEPDPAHRYFGEIRENPKSEGGYSFVRDSRLTGVSTPTKALDGSVDGLLHWAAKLDQVGIADLAGAQIGAGCDVGDLSWLTSQEAIAAALRDAEATWAHVRDRAATRGTNVHERIFLALATGKKPPSLANLSDEERGYGQAAIRWWRDVQPTPLYAEQVTTHPGHRIAGRFDLLCEVDGERVLVDAKTRESGRDRRSDHAQLPGYELANEACGIGGSDRQVILILMPNGEYRSVLCEGTEADFIAGLEAHRAGSDLEKRMRAGAKRTKEKVPA